jgi:Tfp pilus assembly protein PilF
LPHAFALLASLAVTACAQDDAPKRKADHDPAMSAALEGQLLVDPDLSQQNMRNAAVVPGGSRSRHAAPDLP